MNEGSGNIRRHREPDGHVSEGTNTATGTAGLPSSGVLDVESLRAEVECGEIDTVVVALVDLQGRLQGKRYDASFFLDEVAHATIEGCAYLLATDVEMAPVEGYQLCSWDAGFPDMRLRPDLATLRRLPWYPNTVLCLAEAETHSGAPIEVSPRTVLRRQLERLAALGLHARTATELEFLLFATDSAAARAQRFAELVPLVPYNADYGIQTTGAGEPFVGAVRRSMVRAGMVVESSKGECGPGQYEVAIRHSDPVTTADQHAVFKLGVKELAAQHGYCATFMAKYGVSEGSSCHIHVSLWDENGAPVFATSTGQNTEVLRYFLGGLRACAPELMVFLAPNVNSYKRFVPGSFAPTNSAWGEDNRTCAFRVVGEASSRRIENRIPGADVNPYLALAATIAAGCEGIERKLDPGPPASGNAYMESSQDSPLLPSSLADAARAIGNSQVARRAFGEDVVTHYAHMAEVEWKAFSQTVTDWERMRGFVRL